MYCVEQPSDQRLDQKVDERMTENHLPGQYLDIALEARQYKIYCPAKAFDPPTQSGIYLLYITGTFGVVYRGVYTRNNKTIEVAIKTLKGIVAI